jgi:signal transduction histidine kinase
VVASGIETMLPYALVPMVGALVLGTLQERSTALVAGVYVGSAAIVLLIVLRQVLTIRQNARLFAELRRAYSQLEQSHHSLESANVSLAHTEERFRAAAESASDLIYELDFDTGGLEWFGDVHRHTAVRGGGLPPTMQAWEQIIHPEDRDRVIQTLRRHVEFGERYEMEYRVTAGDEYRHWLDRGCVTRRDGDVPRRAVGAVSDLTERKRAEALEGERAGLRQAVSAMEGVLGVVGHELRTPLAGLRAMSEFLLTDGAVGSADCEQMLSGINEEVIRMSETVNDLLEAARLNSGLAKWKWSTFELRAVCEEAIDPVRPLMEESAVTLGCEVEAGVTMLGDADAIRRLVLNLLSNARKYTKHGSIHVTARQTEEAEERWIEILVSDTGAGIPPEIRDRLGEAFALNAGMVGANHVNGTGLGLAICKGIAAAHGGCLAIRSQVGEGTTVVARLRADLAGPMTQQGKSAVAADASALIS